MNIKIEGNITSIFYKLLQVTIIASGPDVRGSQS